MLGGGTKTGTTISRVSQAWARYRLRWMRRRLLWRALRKRRELSAVRDSTSQIRPRDVLLFATIRDEAQRLPFFLNHYRAMGVDHFLIVDNDSTDGSRELLQDSADVSLWRTSHSYRAARFGMDWLGGLHRHYGADHWCLTVDADELLIYPHCETKPLRALTERLDHLGAQAMGALMVDLYPNGPLGTQQYVADQPPMQVLSGFDKSPYRTTHQAVSFERRTQGGTRERIFFKDVPQRSPTLNKVPLVKWQRSFVYKNATHALLPRELNLAYDGPTDARLSGVLLHTKFLPRVTQKAAEDMERQQHFGDPGRFDAYYKQILAQPNLWHLDTQIYQNWQQLVQLGLMSAGGWED